MFVSSLLVTPLSLLLPPIWTSDVLLLPLFPLPCYHLLTVWLPPPARVRFRRPPVILPGGELWLGKHRLAWVLFIAQRGLETLSLYSSHLVTSQQYLADTSSFLKLFSAALQDPSPSWAPFWLVVTPTPHALATSALMGASTLVWRSCVHLLPWERAALDYLEESSQCSFSFYFWFLTDPSTNHCKLSFAFL